MKISTAHRGLLAGLLVGAAACLVPAGALAAKLVLPGCQNVLGSCVTGSASGLDVRVDAILGASVQVGPLPYVALPQDGGFVSEEAVAVQIPEVLTSGTLSTMTAGSINESTGAATSTSIAQVEGLSLLGLVSADLLTAVCTATANANGASADTNGTSVLNLNVFGHRFDVVPPPNTEIPLLLGKAVLNEQTPIVEGGTVVGLSVTLVHVYLDALVAKTDVKVASVSCGASYKRMDGEPEGHFTGGFTLDDGTSRATGGFNVRLKAGLPGGHLEYQDHSAGLDFKSIAITSYGSVENCANFSGFVSEKNEGHYRFRATACDNGEPGTGNDTFAIRVFDEDGTLMYSRGNVWNGRKELLSGGNIQQH